MDLLPKHMCHRCSYKLEEFHKFYMDCLKTDADLKSQLSWMQKENPKERIGIPMVHIENMKLEPPDYEAYDMNPMVDNANYINSMSSVTFQPNDIPYAAYTECRCCCDKMDQSNQTIPTNYENTTLSSCNRLNNVETKTDSCVNESQAVKKNLLVSKTFQERSNLEMRVNENNKNSRWCRPTSSTFDHMDNVKGKFTEKEEISRGVIVRNLRPRKGFVDYVGTRKKLAAISTSKSAQSKTLTLQSQYNAIRIKLEKSGNFAGHVLRPRNGTINYWNRSPQKKYSKSTKQNQSSQGNKYQASKHKVQNIANKLKLPSKEVPLLVENRVSFAIKQEQLSDLDDTVLDKLHVTLPKNRETRITGDLANNTNALPNDLLVSDRNDRNYLSNCTQHDVDFSVTNKLRSLKTTMKNKIKSGKVGVDRTVARSYSPKYLRSQDFFLRNGKVKKFETTNVSTKKFRRNLQNITDTAKPISRNLTEAIGGIISTKKISASIKLIDNDIKHYCEDCNTSFANKELFKLHVCYH